MGDRDRGAQSTRGASPEPGQVSVAASSLQSLQMRAVQSRRKVCSRYPCWQADGLSPTCPGAVAGTWGGQYPSQAPLSWRCWRSAPRVPGVPSLAGQWLMWLRESPVTQEMTLIQRLFPAQLGRALAQLQARR